MSPVASIYKNISHKVGDVVLPGIEAKVYYIPRREIASIKLPKLNGMLPNDTLESRATVSDIVLIDGAFFREIDIIQGQSSFTSEPIGEMPSQLFNQKVSIMIPKSDVEVSAICSLMANDDIVFLIKDMDGNTRIIGSRYQPTIKPGQNLGSKAGDTGVGTKIDIECADTAPAVFYSGDIIDQETAEAGA